MEFPSMLKAQQAPHNGRWVKYQEDHFGALFMQEAMRNQNQSTLDQM